ncbi:hypothetical protein J7E95_32660 [Streptomyces sp. ISL-14]|nr:hypothetical protein [Streptomyces sp. ISL-14]
MSRDLDTLDEAVDAQDEGETLGDPLRVAQNTSDLRLRHEPLRTVDLGRFAMWARQSAIDARAADEGAVAGDVTSLELLWARLKDEAPRAEAAAVRADLREAREAADRKDMTVAGQPAPSLVEGIAEVTR